MFYSLEQICGFLNVPMFTGTKGYPVETKYSSFKVEENPLAKDREFCRKLAGQVDNQDVPVIYEEDRGIYSICVKTPETDRYLFAGPVCANILNYMELRGFCKRHGVKQGSEKQPVQMNFSKIVGLAGVLGKMMNGTEYASDELVKENHLSGSLHSGEKKVEQGLHVEEEEEKDYYHTYEEEQYLVKCIREGDVESITNIEDSFSGNSELFMSRPLSYFKTQAICTVTIAARAAIEGGVRPAESFKMSETFIERIDKCREPWELCDYRKQCVHDYAKMVDYTRENRGNRDFVEQCKKYIKRHYNTKLTLAEVSEAVGASPNYLSRMFMKSEGVSFSDYINRVRIEQVENLLLGTKMSLAKISKEVHFSSASHLGRTFKIYKGMTPQQYRDQHRDRKR